MPSPPSDPDFTTNEPEINPDTGCSPPLNPSPPSHHNTPQQPNSPTTQAEPPTAFTRLPAAVAVEGTFDIKGVHGKFINKTTARYWKGIPGGEKWICMVRSYINFERIVPTVAVRDSACTSVVATDLFSSRFFVSPPNLSHMRSVAGQKDENTQRRTYPLSTMFADTELNGLTGGPRVNQSGDALSNGRSPSTERVMETGRSFLGMVRTAFSLPSWPLAGGRKPQCQLRTLSFSKRLLMTSIGSSKSSPASTHPHLPPMNPRRLRLPPNSSCLRPPLANPSCLHRPRGAAPFHAAMGRGR